MTADVLGRSTIRWVGGLFVACVLLQRFAVPGLPVALLVPVILGGALYGVLRGLAEVDELRLTMWLLASAATLAALVAHATILDRRLVSIGSWALFMTVWAPFTLRLVDRRRGTYVGVLDVVVKATAWLAAGCVVMTATQLAGVPYRDWLAEIVPSTLLLHDFVITYPVSYGSSIYRANAWIGLEPSMVSLQMGVGLVAALLLGSRIRVVALLVTGLICATSGSGFAIVAVALVVILATPARRMLVRYAMAAAAVVVLGLSSPMGQSIVGRLGEGGTEQSSTSLRAIYPYEYLWAGWVSDPTAVLFGAGPGSSQTLAEESGILGLLVPTPVKIFYDYGLLAGGVLAAMILVCYVGGHSRVMSVTLLVSLWTLQPGTTTMLVVAPVLLLVTWWAPRAEERALESSYTTVRGAATSPSPFGAGTLARLLPERLTTRRGIDATR